MIASLFIQVVPVYPVYPSGDIFLCMRRYRFVRITSQVRRFFIHVVRQHEYIPETRGRTEKEKYYDYKRCPEIPVKCYTCKRTQHDRNDHVYTELQNKRKITENVFLILQIAPIYAVRF